jgi:quercetin dioxygenase-like cupin family protein
MRSTQFIGAVGVAALLVLSGAHLTAQDGIKRTDLQKSDLSIPGREVIQQMVELAPGVVVTKHTHPGEEVTVVLEGTLLLEVAGKPASTLKGGQAFTVMGGVAHGVKNSSNTPTKLLVTYIVDKGKPLRTAAP